jgi:hypothetical protein
MCTLASSAVRPGPRRNLLHHLVADPGQDRVFLPNWVDYTMVSRQVAKLQSVGLVPHRSATADRRMNHATVTVKGKATTDAVDRAREPLGRTIFATRDKRDLEELACLMRKFADAESGDDVC